MANKEDFRTATPLKDTMDILSKIICDRLKIDDPHHIEVESKKRVLPSDVKPLRKYLFKHKQIDHLKSSTFFDQFLDTSTLDLLKLGVSLRVRYKPNGGHVYLLYKGPGFIEKDILFRSEFSTKDLGSMLREESRHDIIRFSDTSIKNIMMHHVPLSMKNAMKSHLGASVLSRINKGHFISIYQKEKFYVDLGKAFMEPSLDQIYAFHISATGLHPLSHFHELENEIKSEDQSLSWKMEYIPNLLEFNEKLSKKFHLKPEPLDKYHRCGSIFLGSKQRC